MVTAAVGSGGSWQAVWLVAFETQKSFPYTRVVIDRLDRFLSLIRSITEQAWGFLETSVGLCVLFCFTPSFRGGGVSCWVPGGLGGARVS